MKCTFIFQYKQSIQLNDDDNGVEEGEAVGSRDYLALINAFAMLQQMHSMYSMPFFIRIIDNRKDFFRH